MTRGWTFREWDAFSLRRTDQAPSRFLSEAAPADPLCCADDDPGVTDLEAEITADESERQEARQRDVEPDDYDDSTNVRDDRVRGAGAQSLEELTIGRGLGRGLEEHVGGLRHDRPEPNVNDPNPDAPDQEAV